MLACTLARNELLAEKRTNFRRKFNVVGNKIDLGIKTKVKHILNAKHEPFQDKKGALKKVTYISFVSYELKHHPKKHI